MAKVKTITLNGKASMYDVQFTKAYVAKIISSQSDLYQELIPGELPYNAIKEIYVNEILEAELVGSNLLYVQKTLNHDPYVDRHEPPNAGMGRYKGHTVPAGCDVGQYAVDEALKIAKDLKDQITAEEDWNEYQAEILHAQKMIKENIWVMDHTGGNVKITYIPMSL